MYHSSEHTGLRPLGPNGEGYCPVCHFIEPLTADGRIEEHPTRKEAEGRYNIREAGACPGSYRRPPSHTPYFSRKAMFRVVVDLAPCPACRSKVRTEKGLIAGHSLTFAGSRCPGSGQPV